MKKIMVSALLILIIMMPLITTSSTAGASSHDGSFRVTNQAAQVVKDQIDIRARSNNPGLYKCALPSWLTWLCNALNAHTCPSCYNFMT